MSKEEINKKRRFFLKKSSILTISALVSPQKLLAYSSAVQKKRVVILGGGFGGSRVARLLKNNLPELEVVIIEPYKSYISGPSILSYIFNNNNKKHESIQRSYADLKKLGVIFVHDYVISVDKSSKRIFTKTGLLDYSILVISTGTELRYDEIKSLNGGDLDNLSPYDRQNIAKVKTGIENFKKGIFVISVPESSLMCPPAPYEYALLMSNKIRKEKLPAKVLLLDAGLSPQPPPVAPFFEKYIEDYGDELIYERAAGSVTSVNSNSNKVFTSFGDEIDYDFLSLIPKNGIAKYIVDMNLGLDHDLFVQVDPLTMRCVKDESIYAIGDVARTPYGRSAFAANIAGIMCASDIADRFKKKPYLKVNKRSKKVRVACFPFVKPDLALSMNVNYHLSYNTEGLHLKSQVKVLEPSAENSKQRFDWEKQTLDYSFGPNSQG